MSRYKRHCLQVLQFERGNANAKQSNTIIAAQYPASQIFDSLHRHTVPMQYTKPINIHWFEDYIVHGAP
jgi:hypothetical protein